jgi:glycerol-3-phosphate O-acyltransferase/dihydroxyacetone phosphate acyltransferase
MAYRIVIRTAWLSFLALISLPGLALWTPVFVTTSLAVRRYKQTGPIWDTFDEIAQYKMAYGLGSGLAVWLLAVLASGPGAPLTALAVPLVMWLTLRWVEDAVSAFRALVSLLRLFLLGSAELARVRAWRELLHARVMALAREVGLPPDPERYFRERGGRQKGRVRSGKWGWESGARYFSLKRRRKRDWNEALRWYDVTEYPKMD